MHQHLRHAYYCIHMSAIIHIITYGHAIRLTVELAGAVGSVSLSFLRTAAEESRLSPTGARFECRRPWDDS